MQKEMKVSRLVDNKTKLEALQWHNNIFNLFAGKIDTGIIINTTTTTKCFLYQQQNYGRRWI